MRIGIKQLVEKRGWAIGSVMALLTCCATTSTVRIGVSDQPYREPETLDTRQPERQWKPFERIEKMQLLGRSFVSQGHGTGTWSAQIRADIKVAGAGSEKESADLAEAGLAPIYGQGTLFVQRHSIGGQEVVYYTMEKQARGFFPSGGDWEYGVIGAKGQVQALGKLDRCARCHGEAPRDYVFRESSMGKSAVENSEAGN